MAAGDILSCTVLATGWEAEIVIEGLSDGGTYLMDGSGAQLSDRSTSKVKFTVVSEGYSTSGVLGTITRYVYGTRVRQKAYPNQALAEEAEAGGNLTVTLALSDYIYNDDKNGGAGTSGTDPTVVIGAGFYTEAGGDGGTPNNAHAGLTCTNNSTRDYPKVIARWAVVPYQRITSTFDLEAVAFHRHAANAKPVACVIFSHTDAATDAVAVTDMSKSSAADALPCYKRTITASSYTDNTLYNWQFTAYPWVGDADSVLTTVGGTANAVTLGPLPLYMDSNDDARVYYACVNTSTGADSGTRAFTDYASANASPAATIRYALAQVQAGGGGSTSDFCVIYLQAGSHTWGAGTGTGTNTNGWVTVTRDPSVARADAQITAGSSGAVISATRMLVTDVTIVPAGYLFTGAASRTLWLHNCTVAPTAQRSAQFADTYANAYFTFSTSNAVDYPFAQYSTGNWAMIRGCSATLARGFGSQSAYGPSMVVTSTITTRSTNGAGASVQAARPREYAIVAYNRFYRVNRVSTALPDPAANNTALVCNLVEITTGESGWAASTLGVGTNTPSTNHLSWHNTIAGYAYGLAYTNAADRVISGISQRYDVARIVDVKQDVFDTNGTLTNAWAFTYGVGSIGNLSEWTPDAFAPYYFGLGSGRATGAVGYVADNSYTAGGVTPPGAGAGGGDYHPAAGSVLRNKIPTAADLVIPWDIAGVAYAAGGAAGAYMPAGGSAPPPVNRALRQWTRRMAA